MKDTLTPKQAAFVLEYMVDLNATQAAIRAGYSEKTAGVIAGQNLGKLEIQEAIQARRLELAAKIEVTQERIAAEYARLGFADMATYASWGAGGATLRESNELPEGASLAVAEVSQTITKDGGTIRFKLHDKKGSLDSLAKLLGYFPGDGVTVNVDNREVNFTIGRGYDKPGLDSDDNRRLVVDTKPVIPEEGG